MIPGPTLHRLAARLCSAKTLERVVEPAIADLQREYLDTAGQSPWRRAWILLGAYYAVLKVLAFTVAKPTRLSPEDRGALGRTFAVAGAALVAFSGLLIAFPMAGFPEFVKARHAMLLMPQALPLTFPLGVTLGIAYGIGGRNVSPKAIKIVLVAALACSIVSLGTMLWIMPAANQAFRQDMFNALGNEGVPRKGSTEMSLAELRQDIVDARAHWDLRRVQHDEWSYHIRWALPWATLVLALFACATAWRGATRRRWMVMASCVGYLVLLYIGEDVVNRWGAPSFIGPWLPNLMFGVGATALLLRRTAIEAAGPAEAGHHH